MDRQGIDAAVLSIAPPLFLYWIEPAERVAEAAQMINDAIAAMVEQAPDRFAGLATLPLQDPAAAVVELRRAVGTLGLRGAQIGPHAEGVPLDDASCGRYSRLPPNCRCRWWSTRTTWDPPPACSTTST